MAKIMLVEDDNNLREIYEARLQAEGYTIVAAKDGEEALVIAKAEKPDLVISDVMMPKISGFEMLDILRNTEGLKEVKVIMLTALGQNDDQQRADRLGADRYLVKSQVTLEDIVNVAHQLLEGDGALPVIPAQPAQTAEPAPAPAASVTAVQELAAPEPAASQPAVSNTPVAPEPVSAPEPVAEAPVDTATSDAVADDKLLTDAMDTLVANVEEPAEPVSTVATTLEVPAAQSAPELPIADTQTAASEEADIEAQIENFVAGASTDAPAANEPAAPVPSEPISTPEMPSAPEEPVSTEPLAVGPPVVMPTGDSGNIASPVTVAPVPATEATAAAPEETTTGSVNVAGKKIIQPLDSTPKTDLNTLVAAEEAKEAVAAGTGVITPQGAAAALTQPPTETSAAPTAPAPAPAADDPSNIAL